MNTIYHHNSQAVGLELDIENPIVDRPSPWWSRVGLRLEMKYRRIVSRFLKSD